MLSNKLKNTFFKVINNQSGMGALQALVAGGIAMIIIYSMISMMMFSARKQRYETLKVNLGDLQKRLSGVLNDQASWANTLADTNNPTSMNCLRNQTACAVAGGPFSITHIRDSSGGYIIQGGPTWSAASGTITPGFNEKGEICAGFVVPPASGNDACPFAYKVVWQPLCAAASCTNPGIRITARLVYNPSSTSTRFPIQTGSLTNLFSMTIGTVNPTLIPVNNSTAGAFDTTKYFNDPSTGKYDVVLWRTATTNNLAFRVVTTTTSNCHTGGFTGMVSARQDWTESYDPFELVTISGGQDRQINFRFSGTYDCDVVANGNGVGPFKVALQRTTGNAIVGAGTGVAQNFGSVAGQGVAEFNTGFTLDTNETFYVKQVCDVPGPSDALGVSGGGAILASLSCRLIE